MPTVAPSDLLLGTVLSEGEVLLVSSNQAATREQGLATLYDPTTDRWTPVTPPPHPWEYDWLVALPQGRALLGRVLTGTRDATLLISRYDPDIRGFGLLETVPLHGGAAQSFARPILLLSGELLLIGETQAWRYHPDHGTVAATAAKQTRAHLAALPLPDGQVVVLGAERAVGIDVTTFSVEGERYDAHLDRWLAIAPLDSALRTGFAAAVLTDGRIMLSGGNVYVAPPALRTETVARVDIYNPATDAWSAGAPLPQPATDLATVTLGDGTVLAIGGRLGASGALHPVATARLYDPRGNRWTAAGQMQEVLVGLRIALLRDGRVLLLGRSQDSSGTMKAEIYTPACRPGA